jgi:tol-pal system protein YbgF
MTNSVSIHWKDRPGTPTASHEPAKAVRGLARACGLILALLIFALAPRAVSAQGLFGGGGGGNDDQRAEMSVRINELEGQMRGLNGQIEQLTFQVRQLQDLVQRLQKDTDFRLQDLEKNGAGAAPKPQKRSDLPADLPATAMTAESGAASAASPRPAAPVPSRGAPPTTLGQMSSSDPIGGIIGAAPMDLGAPGARSRDTAPVPGVDPRYASAQPTPSARDEYDAAYGYILNGEYELAERSFRSFLANHPTDNRIGAAEFWLGETYFARAMNREAADAFLKSYTQFPDGAKAADSLLKLGMALSGLGEKKAACASWDELLSKYPKASKAIRDRAAAEKSRGKCS